jgi:hypothetical protein
VTRSHRMRRLAGSVAAVLTAAAGLVGLSSAPAAAAFCSGNGVNVVVDFNGLGGGVRRSCDPNGAGRTADKVFPAAGFNLTYAQRQPGFVCRVNGTPGSDPCQNASPSDAYWGLFWSDGKSGKWSYSSTGVGGLKVPNGGFVAFSWQGSEAKDPPSASPSNQQSTPSPKPTPTKSTPKNGGGGTGDGSGGGTSGGTGGTQQGSSEPTRSAGTNTSPAATPTATRSRRPRPSASGSASPKPSASPSPTASATDSDEVTPEATTTQRVDGGFRSDDQDGGLPTWIPVVVIIGLAAAAGGALRLRRRTGA